MVAEYLEKNYDRVCRVSHVLPFSFDCHLISIRIVPAILLVLLLVHNPRLITELRDEATISEAPRGNSPGSREF